MSADLRNLAFFNSLLRGRTLWEIGWVSGVKH
jgi:hypothetical protein